ncbi:MAG: hypothetical protein JSW54_11510 [Fidelibacterota bacterium]|nr:MAG: hypothetical protein JSW54_11510 [Candidatus Neomarinimicrobiota bacterium]
MKASPEQQITINESIRRKMHALQTMTRKIAHDTNNYYGIIQGYFSLLETPSADNDLLQKYLPAMKEALLSGIELNQRLARFYRESQGMVAPADLVAVAGEVCAAFKQEHNFTAQVVARKDVEPVLLDESAFRSLIENLCLLARKTGTDPAVMELAPVQLEDEAVAAMVLDSRPGRYIRLLMTISLADFPQTEDTEFLNPFFIDPHRSEDLGLALLYSFLRNHHGNLDVTLQDHDLTLAIYLPCSNK